VSTTNKEDDGRQARARRRTSASALRNQDPPTGGSSGDWMPAPSTPTPRRDGCASGVRVQDPGVELRQRRVAA